MRFLLPSLSILLLTLAGTARAQADGAAPDEIRLAFPQAKLIIGGLHGNRTAYLRVRGHRDAAAGYHELNYAIPGSVVRESIDGRYVDVHAQGQGDTFLRLDLRTYGVARMERRETSAGGIHLSPTRLETSRVRVQANDDHGRPRAMTVNLPDTHITWRRSGPGFALSAGGIEMLTALDLEMRELRPWLYHLRARSAGANTDYIEINTYHGITFQVIGGHAFGGDRSRQQTIRLGLPLEVIRRQAAPSAPSQPTAPTGPVLDPDGTTLPRFDPNAAPSAPGAGDVIDPRGADIPRFEPREAPTTLDPSAMGPMILSPTTAEDVPNGSHDHSVPSVWAFRWTAVPGAARYQVVVRGPGATQDLFQVIVDGTVYFHHSNSWVSEANQKGWTVKVRAFKDGRWGAFSTAGFNVGPLR